MMKGKPPARGTATKNGATTNGARTTIAIQALASNLKNLSLEIPRDKLSS